ncbi:glycoside hydrolase family 2 protein [Rhizobium sp. TRM95111]|uniref:glycosyl hydrolase 2 galactose-binding domain-containing protein n=1 Tax=Rhizobium alarense TaxID=2846851 RepID=UPI001F2873FE|nr:glycoside hydrolase family 2 protein [Rhizobium alarense]MCF3640459.1 glycoside hydrolase family 2 protein [Rhizobium alarense]
MAVPATGRRLDAGWRLVLTEAGACATPLDIDPQADMLAAPVPSTVAGALERAGRFDRTAPVPLDGGDAWYLLDLDGEAPGEAVLRFEGLATIADIFWNGAHMLTVRSMFVPQEVPVSLTGRDRLSICFRALGPELDRRGPRARWRPQMITPQGLRLHRTTLLGRMPGWCPQVHAVGPYRPVVLLRKDGAIPSGIRLQATLDDDGTGRLAVHFEAAGLAGPVLLECAGVQVAMERDAGGMFRGKLALAGVAPWWPHTHGDPTLHAVFAVIGGRRVALGRTGFRRIAVDRGADGRDFALVVNGERIFCRGAVWTNADIVDLPGDGDRYAPLLQLARDAGMNMLRVGGTMTYETPAFFALCDRLGILVWQDLMFANFDYPVQDADFLGLVHEEVSAFLAANAAAPSLAVLCGGSEMHQQGAMLGLPETAWRGPLTGEILPALCAEGRPDVPYVPNSPSGGAMPFTPNAGVTHYYGVGAYCRPLEDARRAGVRFAAECLAFANVPEPETLERHLPVPAVHDPRWKARVPRDRGASWDFEDVRDHYLGDLYGVDPARLRREEPARYLDLSRAVTGEVIEATFGEWRRPGSTCNGALVWTFLDLLPGAGWGAVDATGRPKSAWWAMKRAFRPLQVLLSDEGTNGLDVHVVNETAEVRAVTVELACLRDGRLPVVSGTRSLAVGPRGAATLAATDLFGAFFDTTYAFRFGPPAHDATVARLRDTETGRLVAEAFHFPRGRSAALREAQLSVELAEGEGGWSLALAADRLAQTVHIRMEGAVPDDNGFHLAPGTPRVIPLHHAGRRPTGEIAGLNIAAPVSF